MATPSRRIAGILAAVAALVLGVLGVQPVASATPLTGLAGVNDFSCTPAPDRPRPVVLVHGTGANSLQTWRTLAPALQGAGYCVFTLDYGAAGGATFGLGDIGASARELAAFVDTVRARTGSPRVDIVGHSQGGTAARQYLRFEGGADAADPSRNKVQRLVMLGPTTHGSTFNGMHGLVSAFTALGITTESLNEQIAASTVGLAFYQQLTGSRFLADLNAGRETFPGIDYTVIASRDDAIVTPPEAAFLTPEPGASVRNEWLQDTCPGAVVSHAGLVSDPRAAYLVQSGLDPAHRARAAAPC